MIVLVVPIRAVNARDAELVDRAEEVDVCLEVFRDAAFVGWIGTANGFLDALDPLVILPPVVVVLALPFAVGIVELAVCVVVEFGADLCEGRVVRVPIPVPVAVRITRAVCWVFCVFLGVLRLLKVWIHSEGSVIDCTEALVQSGVDVAF